jgi:predicted dehydrogenase
MVGPTEPGVGLISVGWMGKLHSRAYQALPSIYPELRLRPRLVHAADTAPERVAYAREVLGYARASLDYQAVLADPEVDVVSICAPNALHREIGVAAAEAGKPFWIEKPVGRDAAETGAVAEAAARAGVTTSIGYNYRHAPAIERIRALVAAGSSSAGTPPIRRRHCPGGSGASWPAPEPWATCSATSSIWCSTPSGRSPRSAR